MYHRILRSKGGAMRMYEVENGKPVRDAQFHVVPLSGDRFDMYDMDDELIVDDARATSCEVRADQIKGSFRPPERTGL